jgi:hypothetical protein
MQLRPEAAGDAALAGAVGRAAMSARFGYDLLGPLKARGRAWEKSGRKRNLDELQDDGDIHPCVFLLCAALMLAVVLAGIREVASILGRTATSVHSDEL